MSIMWADCAYKLFHEDFCSFIFVIVWQDEDSLCNKLCTFTITQKEFMNQHW